MAELLMGAELAAGETAYGGFVAAAGFAGLATVMAIMASYTLRQAAEIGRISVSFTNQDENEEAKLVADELGLTKEEADILHREISNNPWEDIWDAGERIAEKGIRDALNRRGGRPKNEWKQNR